jgi:1,3-beta-glucan synthase
MDLAKNLTIPISGLMQPLDKNNNDTMVTYTGNNIPAGFEPVESSASVATATS